jgi:general secretion pathway protein G
MRQRRQERSAFTLFELVVVIMILGILAAIAVPRMIDTSHQATENTARQTLGVIRTAIDQYSVEHNGKWPGADGQEATLKSDLTSYLRGNDFPKCPIGEAKNGAVRMLAGSGSIAASIGGTATTHSWVYQYEIGELHINSTADAVDGVTTYDGY